MTKPSGHLVHWFYHYLWVGLDWIYPPQCAGCGVQSTRWCRDCHRKIVKLDSPICPICGEFETSGEVCSDCNRQRPKLERLRSVAVYDGVIRKAIIGLKYYRNIALGEVLAEYLVQCYRQQGWCVDFVVPVPLGLDRLAARGYNQTSLLARPTAYQLGIRYQPNAISRYQQLRSQVGLSAQDRRTNVYHAFAADPHQVYAKKVLIIDDVTTTGSTIEACAASLLEAGAEKVYGLTLARAKFEDDQT